MFTVFKIKELELFSLRVGQALQDQAVVEAMIPIQVIQSLSMETRTTFCTIKSLQMFSNRSLAPGFPLYAARFSRRPILPCHVGSTTTFQLT